MCQVVVVRKFMGQEAPERILWRQVEEIVPILYVNIMLILISPCGDSLGLRNECNDHLFKLKQQESIFGCTHCI
jgi:hypothetical protein